MAKSRKIPQWIPATKQVPKTAMTPQLVQASRTKIQTQALAVMATMAAKNPVILQAQRLPAAVHFPKELRAEATAHPNALKKR